MRLVFALVAQSVSIDQVTNRLSLFNVVEGIQAPQFPTVMPELAFVTVLRREPNDPGRFETTLTVRMGETVIGHAGVVIDFENKPNTRLIGSFQGMPILAPGTLEFVLAIPNGDPIIVSIEAVQGPVGGVV